MLDHTKC